MEGSENGTKQSVPLQLQQSRSAHCLDAPPVTHPDNVAYDFPTKEQQKPVGTERSYELEKREPIDSDLSEDLDIQKPTDSEIGFDLEKQKSQFNGSKDEVIGDQDEVPAEDPNLVCLPLRAGRERPWTNMQCHTGDLVRPR